MPRNPHASNLRHHKPKRIEDKRDKLLERHLARIGQDIDSGVATVLGVERLARLREITADIEIDRDSDRIEGDVGL